MSSQELHYGVIKELDLKGKTIEEVCEERCKKLKISPEDYYEETYVDVVKSEPTATKLFIFDDKLYELVEHTEEDGEDIMFMKKIKKGTYAFVTSFYNGGTCFSECIEDLLHGEITKPKK